MGLFLLGVSISPILGSISGVFIIKRKRFLSVLFLFKCDIHIIRLSFNLALYFLVSIWYRRLHFVASYLLFTRDISAHF